MPRPKGSKKEKHFSSTSPTAVLPSSTNDFLTDEINTLKNSFNRKSEHLLEFQSTRVVVNPAVLRYLEQNRHSVTPKTDEEFFNDFLPLQIDEEESTPTCQQLTTKNEISNIRRVSPIEFLREDFSTCSNEFLLSAQLAQWILTHPQTAQLQSLTVNHKDIY